MIRRTRVRTDTRDDTAMLRTPQYNIRGAIVTGSDWFEHLCSWRVSKHAPGESWSVLLITIRSVWIQKQARRAHFTQAKQAIEGGLLLMMYMVQHMSNHIHMASTLTTKIIWCLISWRRVDPFIWKCQANFNTFIFTVFCIIYSCNSLVGLVPMIISTIAAFRLLAIAKAYRV